MVPQYRSRPSPVFMHGRFILTDHPFPPFTMTLAEGCLGAVSTAVAICLLYYFIGNSAQRLPLPPGPPGDPIIGHLRSLPQEDEPGKAYHEWAKKYGS